MLSVSFTYCYAKCLNVKRHYAECRYSGCRGAIYTFIYIQYFAVLACKDLTQLSIKKTILCNLKKELKSVVSYNYFSTCQKKAKVFAQGTLTQWKG